MLLKQDLNCQRNSYNLIKMRYAYKFKQRIDNLFSISRSIPDDEIKSAVSRHLCILTSGYLELSLKEIILEYAENKSAPIVQNYIEKTIKNLVASH